MPSRLPRLGSFVLLRELGRGANGVVYEARRDGLQRSVAIKVLIGWQRDSEGLARFQREANVASKIEDPGVVRVHDHGLTAGQHWYAMDYCPGPTLADRLAELGRLPWGDAARVVAQVARTMGVAHAQGIVHRDLKPSNIILDEERGRPRVTDFGMARDEGVGQGLTRTGTAMGTPVYMAPEQVDAKHVTAAADVYSLGAVLYECLTGRVPIEADTSADLFAKLPHAIPLPPRELAPELPRSLESICARTLEKDPGNRYADGTELAEALERALLESGEGLGAPGAGVSRRALAAGGVACALLVVVLGVWTLGGEAPPPQDPEPPAEVRDPPTTEDGSQRLRTARAAGPEAWQESVALLRAAGRADEGSEVGALVDEQARQVLSDAVASTQELRELDQVALGWLGAVEAVGPAPLATQARHARLDALFRRGRYREVMAESEAPKTLVARHLRARTLDKVGRGREGYAARRDLWRDDPQGAVGLTALGEIAFAVDDGQGALRAARDARELDPDYRPAKILEAQGLISSGGDLEECAALLEGLDDPAATIARLTLLRSEFARAEAELAQARLLTGSRDLDVLRNQALLRLMSKRPGPALESLDVALQERSGDPRCLLLRSMVRNLSGNPAGSIADVRAAQAADPAGFETYIQEVFYGRDRRRIRQELGLPQWAPWRQTLPVPPGPAGFARIEERVGKVAAVSQEPLREALWIAAEGWDGWEKIRPPLERALAAAPDDASLALEVARLKVGRDRPDALEALQRARILGAPEDEVRLEEATAMFRNGDYVPARDRYRSLAGAAGRTARIAAAELALLEGRVQDARTFAQAVLDADPGDARAWVLVSKSHQPESVRLAAEHALRGVALDGSLDARTLVVAAMAQSLARRGDQSVADSRAWQGRRRHMRQACAVSASAFPCLALATDRLLSLRNDPRRRGLSRTASLIEAAKLASPKRVECWLLGGLTASDVDGLERSWARASELDPKARLNDGLLEVVELRFGSGERVKALIAAQRSVR